MATIQTLKNLNEEIIYPQTIPEAIVIDDTGRNIADELAELSDIKQRIATSNITIYVATTGSDTTGDGTQAKPYKTIQKGINALPKLCTSGQIIDMVIASGTYTESPNFYEIPCIVRVTGTNVTINGNVAVGGCFRIQWDVENTIINYNVSGRACIETNSSVFWISSKVTLNGANIAVGLYVNFGGEIHVIWHTASLTINNCTVGVNCEYGGKISAVTLTGTGLSVGIQSNGGDVKYITNTLVATTPMTTYNHGTINNNVYGYSTTDLTAGTSYLPTGMMYYVYE